MSAIRRLDPETVGRIAAGEVVERPAAALKELVENALDAGARRIAVRLAEGGLRLLEVTDDGQGMEAEDLPLAVERYATSKIRGVEDLDRLASYGFRGEALPAIAAVSRLTLASRPPEAPFGHQLTVQAGAVGPVSPVGMAPGTRVTVEDLFAPVPARRRFLKSPQAEAAACHDLVRRLALAAPGVAFRLLGEGREVWRSPGDGALGNLFTTLFAPGGGVLPLRGEVAVAEGGGTIRLTGFATDPGASRSSRLGQTFVVNGRLVQSAALRYALEAAYRGHLPRGRYPAAVLVLEVPPPRVDVNIHPQKREVRLADERQVQSLVQRTVEEALSRARGGGWTMAGAPAPLRAPAAPAPWPSPPPPEAPWPPPGVLERSRVGEPPPPPEGDASPPAEGAPAVPLWGELHLLRQLHGLYLLAEDAGALYLFDQHAASERVVYERLAGAGPQPHQVLLEPQVVAVGRAGVAAWEANPGALAPLGLEVSAFGPDALAVHRIPAGLRDVAQVVADLVEDLASRGLAPAEAEHRRRALVACHAAVRAGDPLAVPEMERLVRELGRCANPFTCPHGRPTVHRLPWSEVGGWFRRRG